MENNLACPAIQSRPAHHLRAIDLADEALLREALHPSAVIDWIIRMPRRNLLKRLHICIEVWPLSLHRPSIDLIKLDGNKFIW